MAVYRDWASARNGSPNAQSVNRYNDLMQQLADASKKPGFSRDRWDELKEVVRSDVFTRFGNFLEIQNWNEYVEMLHDWAPGSRSFSTTFRRMVDSDGIVYLELVETHDMGDINSVSVYEFDAAAKIVGLHIYLQLPRAA
jgi:hypothetical protein